MLTQVGFELETTELYLEALIKELPGHKFYLKLHCIYYVK